MRLRFLICKKASFLMMGLICIHRFDGWHFMRRLSTGCTTDAHPLYGVFMARLSQCIFQWEEEDMNQLKKVKKVELLQQHIPSPSDTEINRHIKRVNWLSIVGG